MVRGMTIRTLKIFSYFFPFRCSLVSEERFDLDGVRHAKFRSFGATSQSELPLTVGAVHCDTNVIAHGSPATDAAEHAKRERFAITTIAALVIPSF